MNNNDALFWIEDMNDRNRGVLTRRVGLTVAYSVAQGAAEGHLLWEFHATATANTGGKLAVTS